MSKLVEAAQEYAILGWQVLPCHPRGKAPLLEHGLLQATADPDQVRWWWSRWPAANIGIRTGDLVDVIDVDSRAGLAALTENAGAHPLSWGPVAQTGRGWHYYLASAGRRTRIGFVPGVDLKAAGGYVIAPPSIHATGRPYRWLEGRHRIGWTRNRRRVGWPS